MTSFKQHEANRLNALKSTGPKSEEGKRRSRGNAVRHGLTAETIIVGLEDPEDYEAFEAAVIADHDATSAVERELVLRLASVLWRLRRATGIETSLFESATRQPFQLHSKVFGRVTEDQLLAQVFLKSKDETENVTGPRSPRKQIMENFLRLSEMPTCPISRLNRYEYILWRQARQIMITLRSTGEFGLEVNATKRGDSRLTTVASRTLANTRVSHLRSFADHRGNLLSI